MVLTDEKRALLGDHEAAKRLTDAGVLLPCAHCGGEAKFKKGFPSRQIAHCRQAVVQCKKCGVRTVTHRQLPFVSVISGDETGIVIFEDGTTFDFDSSDSRIMGFDDGSYVVPETLVDEWMDWESGEEVTLSYERQHWVWERLFERLFLPDCERAVCKTLEALKDGKGD